METLTDLLNLDKFPNSKLEGRNVEVAIRYADNKKRIPAELPPGTKWNVDDIAPKDIVPLLPKLSVPSKDPTLFDGEKTTLAKVTRFTTEKQRLLYKINFLRRQVSLRPFDQDKNWLTYQAPKNPFKHEIDARKIHVNEARPALFQELVRAECEYQLILAEEAFSEDLKKWAQGSAKGRLYQKAFWSTTWGENPEKEVHLTSTDQADQKRIRDRSPIVKGRVNANFLEKDAITDVKAGWVYNRLMATLPHDEQTLAAFYKYIVQEESDLVEDLESMITDNNDNNNNNPASNTGPANSSDTGPTDAGDVGPADANNPGETPGSAPSGTSPAPASPTPATAKPLPPRPSPPNPFAPAPASTSPSTPADAMDTTPSHSDYIDSLNNYPIVTPPTPGPHPTTGLTEILGPHQPPQNPHPNAAAVKNHVTEHEQLGLPAPRHAKVAPVPVATTVGGQIVQNALNSVPNLPAANGATIDHLMNNIAHPVFETNPHAQKAIQQAADLKKASEALFQQTLKDEVLKVQSEFKAEKAEAAAKITGIFQPVKNIIDAITPANGQSLIQRAATTLATLESQKLKLKQELADESIKNNDQTNLAQTKQNEINRLNTVIQTLQTDLQTAKQVTIPAAETRLKAHYEKKIAEYQDAVKQKETELRTQAQMNVEEINRIKGETELALNNKFTAEIIQKNELIAEKEAEHQIANSKIVQLETTLANGASQLHALQLQLSNAPTSEIVQQLNRDVALAQQMIGDREQEMQVLRQRANQLQSLIAQERASVKTQHDDLQNSLQELQIKAGEREHELQQELAKWAASHKENESKYNAHIQKQMQELQQAKAAEEAANQKEAATLQELVKTQSSFNENNEKLKQYIEAHAADRQKLQIQAENLNQVKAQQEAAETAMQAALAKKTVLEKELEEALANEKYNAEGMETLKKELETLEQTIWQKAQERINFLTAQANDLVSQKNETIGQYHEYYENAEKQGQYLQSQLKHWQQYFEQADAHGIKLQETVTRQQEQIAAQQSKIDLLYGWITDAKNSHLFEQRQLQGALDLAARDVVVNKRQVLRLGQKLVSANALATITRAVTNMPVKETNAAVIFDMAANTEAAERNDIIAEDPNSTMVQVLDALSKGGQARNEVFSAAEDVIDLTEDEPMPRDPVVRTPEQMQSFLGHSTISADNLSPDININDAQRVVFEMFDRSMRVAEAATEIMRADVPSASQLSTYFELQQNLTKEVDYLGDNAGPVMDAMQASLPQTTAVPDNVSQPQMAKLYLDAIQSGSIPGDATLSQAAVAVTMLSESLGQVIQNSNYMQDIVPKLQEANVEVQKKIRRITKMDREIMNQQLPELMQRKRLPVGYFKGQAVSESRGRNTRRTAPVSRAEISHVLQEGNENARADAVVAAVDEAAANAGMPPGNYSPRQLAEIDDYISKLNEFAVMPDAQLAKYNTTSILQAIEAVGNDEQRKTPLLHHFRKSPLAREFLNVIKDRLHLRTHGTLMPRNTLVINPGLNIKTLADIAPAPNAQNKGGITVEQRAPAYRGDTTHKWWVLNAADGFYYPFVDNGPVTAAADRAAGRAALSSEADKYKIRA